MKNKRIFKLQPTIQNYAWGGHDFIPELIGNVVDPALTYAELWMGDHVKSPSTIPDNLDGLDLHTLIQTNPQNLLGSGSILKFGSRLPFLFKVLDVNRMLSIQSHPTKLEAKVGFKKEQLEGIPLHSFNRTFKDDNHKPELMVALSPFWLLHGLRPEMEIKSIFNGLKSLQYLQVHLDKGIHHLLDFFFRAPEDFIRTELTSLQKELETMEMLDRSSPHYWVEKAIDEHGLDRGLIFFYLLNLVYLEPGEAIYQAPGIPHAYLEGKNIEIMANSDNVIRGGLTKKYTNIDLLLDHLKLDPVVPEIISGIPDYFGIRYPAPVEDFLLYRIQGQDQRAKFSGASICLVYSGKGRIMNTVSMDIEKGDVIYISPEESILFSGEFTGFFATSII